MMSEIELFDIQLVIVTVESQEEVVKLTKILFLFWYMRYSNVDTFIVLKLLPAVRSLYE